MSTIKRIGILNAGGDCPGLNAVIHGAVRAACQHSMDVLGIHNGYEGLLDLEHADLLTTSSTYDLASKGGTILGTTNRGHFAARCGMDGRLEIDPLLLADVHQRIDRCGIEALVCVGGDGSLAIAEQLCESGIPVVGVPKTIDNDVSATSFTFGFDSAVACATDAIDRLHTTAESHGRVMFLEVMGRYAGWIALHAGIAGEADVILVPEVPWQVEIVEATIKDRLATRGFAIVVVAEGVGASTTGEGLECQPHLDGAVDHVVEQLSGRIDCELRKVVLGHLQRGGKPTAFDRALAVQYGAHAIRLILERKFGEMVCYEPPQMTSAPLSDAIHVSRITPNCSIVDAARAMGVCLGNATSGKPTWNEPEVAACLS